MYTIVTLLTVLVLLFVIRSLTKNWEEDDFDMSDFPVPSTVGHWCLILFIGLIPIVNIMLIIVLLVSIAFVFSKNAATHEFFSRRV